MTIRGQARRDDPETSHEAAESVDASQLMTRIYNVMLRYGNRGCIADEVERSMPEVTAGKQSITPRFRQMLDRGMIECTGEKRKGYSGRMQLVRRCLPEPFQPSLAMPMRQSTADKFRQRVKEVENLPRYGGQWLKADDVLAILEGKEPGCVFKAETK
jgi:hypothetical protein